MSSNGHSKIGASSSYRWMNCPGSVRVLETVPKTSSEYADEGSVAHKVAESALKTGKDTSNWRGVPFWFNCKKWIITDEIVSYTQMYVDYVRSLFTKPEQLTVEHKFNLDWLHPGMYGTCDALVDVGKDLYVIDLKYGQGVSVDAFWNPQLLYYALGGVHGGKYENVHLVIHQPRIDASPNQWSLAYNELMLWGKSILKPAAIRATDPKAPLISGEWCHKSFCAYLGKCPAAASASLELAKSEFADPMARGLTPPPPDKLSHESLAKILRMLYWADKTKSAYEAYAVQLLSNGEKLPGLKLVKKRANQVWKNETVSALAFKEILHDEAFKPRTLLSPSQMEAVWKKKRKDAFPEGHIEKPDGGVTLAMEEDKREAVNVTPALVDFLADEDFLN